LTVVVVDSSGWLEYFADGPNADHFAPAIEHPQDLLVPTIVLYEVFKRVLQQRGEDDALQAVAVMHQARIVDITSDIALSAAQLSIALSVPMADALILAAARQADARLLTQDSDFAAIDGVDYVAK
jgi:predicted nucleic acid-binding protein